LAGRLEDATAILQKAAAWEILAKTPKAHTPELYDEAWKNAYEHIDFLLASACKGEQTWWHLKHLAERIMSGLVAMGGRGNKAAVAAGFDISGKILKGLECLEQHNRKHVKSFARKSVSWPAFISPLPEREKENRRKLKSLEVGQKAPLRVAGKWRTGTEPNAVALQLYRYIEDNSVAVSSYTAAVLTCRKLLMNIAVAQGAGPGKTFVSYVEHLAASGYVPPNGRGWVDHIRTKGNEANHEIVLMSKAEAEELISFAEMLLKFIYEFSSRVPKPKT
jgi:hypothetical protein